MQSIGKLNFDDGIRTIEVNDKGEYISLSINDNTLVERFAEFLHWFEESQARVHTYAEKFEKKYGYVTREDDNGDTEVNTEAVLELCSFQSNFQNMYTLHHKFRRLPSYQRSACFCRILKVFRS